jgi:hypothetical protein
MREAILRESFQFGIESERRQCGVSHETSSKQTGYVAVNTKSFGKALILNQFVSKNETVVFNTKVEMIWGRKVRNMLSIVGNGLIDDYNGWRKDD